MNRKHVAFCLEQAYGHIIPTFGIALELKKRGHKVSYALNRLLAPMIQKLGMRAVIFDPPPEDREKTISAIVSENDCLSYKVGKAEMAALFKNTFEDRSARSLGQLEQLFSADKPDVIIHDDCSDTAGRDLASRWGIARIRHHSQFLEEGSPVYSMDEFTQDKLVILTLPEFFQRDRSYLDQRFRFVGFIPEGRDKAFEPWRPRNPEKRPILISATTGLLPQIDFCKMMIEVFRSRPFDVVLSISGSRDAVSAIDPGQLRGIPPNIQLNTSASNFEILKDACLFIGQGGQGASLEAIFRGVPQIVIPPTPYHYAVGRRVRELGLGECMPLSDLSPDSFIERVVKLSDDQDTVERVKSASIEMRNHEGASLAADTIEGYLSVSR